MMRFHVFRWLDFLTFGLPAILASGLAAGAVVTPGNPLIGKLIAGATALGFMFVYAMIAARRLAFLNRIVYVSAHGIFVMRPEHGVEMETRILFEKEVERVTKLWEGAVLKENGNPAVVRRSLQGVSLTWRTAPFDLHTKPGFKWMGMTSASAKAMQVGYKDPVESTALGHEIGHVVLLAWKGDGSDETLKRMHEQHGVPY